MRFAILFDGAVAQLGERQNRTLEAGGSIPLCSTKNEKGDGPLLKSRLSLFLRINSYKNVAIRV
jgi:hypothetical protein